MSDKSAIEWTQATWNPVVGCSKVSPGCAHCYAEGLSLRFGHSKLPWTPENAAENVVLHPERLDAPLRWRKPRLVFVNSMSDLFHEQVPDEFIERVFAVMALTPQHTFQVLTKRPERMRALIAGDDFPDMVDATIGETSLEWIEYLQERFNWESTWPLPNVWLGVSAENQRWADERIPLLLDTPAAVRFVSLEPLLGPIDLKARQGGTYDYLEGLDFELLEPWPDNPPKLNWVIVGGESGLKHRPMDVAWVESIAEQCGDADVPLFVKQASGPYPGKQGALPDALWSRKEMP